MAGQTAVEAKTAAKNNLGPIIRRERWMTDKVSLAANAGFKRKWRSEALSDNTLGVPCFGTISLAGSDELAPSHFVSPRARLPLRNEF